MNMNQDQIKRQLQERGAFIDPGTHVLVMAKDGKFAMDNTNLPMGSTPNSDIPFALTQWIDTNVIDYWFAPKQAAIILGGEVQKGDWTMDTVTFPTIEYGGEVSIYGDFNNNGMATVNTNFISRQSTYYQGLVKYGERDEARYGLAKIAYAAEQQKAVINNINWYQNDTYFYGVAGLPNYGLLNDSSLSAAITPSVKFNGGTSPLGTTWFAANGQPNATSVEVYNDILALFNVVVAQTNGIVNIDAKSDMVLALSPTSMTALGFINTFNVKVREVLRDEFPNMRIENAYEYGVLSAGNPQGNSAGNFVQLICGGHDCAFPAFNEKLRTHRQVFSESGMTQKFSQGSYGTIIVRPYLISQMVGV